jgi:hypothetical protein
LETGKRQNEQGGIDKYQNHNRDYQGLLPIHTPDEGEYLLPE